MYALILGNDVVQVEEVIFDVAPPLFWAPCPNFVSSGHIYDGKEFMERMAPAKSQEQIEDEYARALENHLDSVARGRKYTNALSCISYITSKNPAWAAEAKAFSNWRDDVFNEAITIHEHIAARKIMVMPMAEFIAAMPVIEWPTFE